MDKDGDIVGLLAYGIYKQQKIEHIANFKTENGRGPTDEELASFHTFSSSLTQVQHYKELAAAQFNSIITKLMENNLEKFRAAACQGERDKEKEML